MQQFAWAIVTPRGKLAIFDGRCPIYWRRHVAETERLRRGSQCRVVKVTVLEVHRVR